MQRHVYSEKGRENRYQKLRDIFNNPSYCGKHNQPYYPDILCYECASSVNNLERKED